MHFSYAFCQNCALRSHSKYDNHSSPSTTARNGSPDDQDNIRNGSQNDEHDDDGKSENNVSQHFN